MPSSASTRWNISRWRGCSSTSTPLKSNKTARSTQRSYRPPRIAPIARECLRRSRPFGTLWDRLPGLTLLNLAGMVPFEGELMENVQAQPVHPENNAAADGGAEEHPVTLTAKAVEMVKITRGQEGIDPSHGLRGAGRAGGCSGFEYALDYESEARETDWVYEQSALTVYVDAVSARYLEGTSIDYVLGMAGAGFKFNNPKAAGT